MYTYKNSKEKNKTIQEVPAEKIWNEMCQSAWECADPGVQFNDVINEFHTCADTSKINASNPCSEYMFIDDSACNLASLNLTKFFGENYSVIFNLQKLDFLLKNNFLIIENNYLKIPKNHRIITNKIIEKVCETIAM
jgi:ribonucleoside-diphosphate reductase alpha chain